MRIFIYLVFIFQSGLISVNAQWMPVNSGMENISIMSLAYNGNTIFAGTYAHGLYLTTNYGINWTQTSLNNQYVSALAVNGNNIFAGTTANTTVYLSSDNGGSWTPTSLNNQYISSLAANAIYIFAGSYGPNDGVYLSTNNGNNWTHIFNTSDVWELALSGSYVFAGTVSGGYLSTNNGTNWTQTFLNNQSVRSFAVNGDTIFAGTEVYGVYLSVNNGTSWTQTSLNNRPVWSLAVNGNNIFAGTMNYGVYVSNDNGASWIQRNEGLSNLRVQTLFILNNYVYAGTFGNGVYRRPLSEFTGIKTISREIPNQFSLSQNYPNPFNPMTKINYSVPHKTFVTIEVYDVIGREVELLVNEFKNTGNYDLEWNAVNFASGVYFYRMEAEDYVQVRKMVILK